MKRHGLVRILVLTVITASCSLGGADYVIEPPVVPPIEENSTFFHEVTGTITFSTNNSLFQSQTGYTLWAVDPNRTTSATEEFGDFSCTVRKTNGNSEAGYGLILCHTEKESGDFVMYVIMINTQQKYILGKAVNSIYTPIQAWTHSDQLHAGLGVGNDISIHYESGSQNFSVSFNNTQVTTFAKDSEIGCFDSIGYLVVISPFDNLANETISAMFTPQ